MTHEAEKAWSQSAKKTKWILKGWMRSGIQIKQKHRGTSLNMQEMAGTGERKKNVLWRNYTVGIKSKVIKNMQFLHFIFDSSSNLTFSFCLRQVTQCRCGWPGTHYVWCWHQTPRGLPASTIRVLEWKARSTVPGPTSSFHNTEVVWRW